MRRRLSGRRLPRPSRGLTAVAAVLVLALVGGYVAVRDSSLVAVERVSVRGASGPDAPKVEAALRRVAQGMTTLNADAGALREAVDDFPTVGDVQLDRDLPHDLTVIVLERRPVGVVTSGGRRVPVAADGRLLRGATPPDDVPVLALEREPQNRVDDERGRRLLAVVGAAPDALRRKARRAYLGSRGLTLAMKDGPSVYFGTTRDLRAKWQAAARVLADPTAEGARYVDVRVPGRAAVGGLAPLSSAEGDPADPATPPDPAAAVDPAAPVVPADPTVPAPGETPPAPVTPVPGTAPATSGEPVPGGG